MASFEPFAICKICWAILHRLCGEDWVPRHVRTRAQEVERIWAKLYQDLLRLASEGEMIEEVGMGPEEYRGFLNQYSRPGALPEARLDTQNGTIGEYGSLLVDDAAPDPRSQASLEALRAPHRRHRRDYREHERLVATFYPYEGLTLKEIGKATTLTECRISQLLKRALGKPHERQVLPPRLRR